MVKIAKAKTQSSKEKKYETAEPLSENKYLEGELSHHQISKSQNHEVEHNNDEQLEIQSLSSQDDNENSQNYLAKGTKGISKNEKR